MEAHYTNGTKIRPATLTIATNYNGCRVWITTHQVSGKVEARKLAKWHNATPWNF